MQWLKKPSDFKQEIRLHKRLSSAESYAARIHFENFGVFHDLLSNIFCLCIEACNGNKPLFAGAYALLTTDTFTCAAGRTYRGASAAVRTQTHLCDACRGKIEPLGVMTPHASERTALKEYDGSNARAVVHCELLNIENFTCHRIFLPI